ncbi:MAG: PSD1 and planctomycete cytochrome C domain-containing protein [Planctomycetaceae bacterium]
MMRPALVAVIASIAVGWMLPAQCGEPSERAPDAPAGQFDAEQFAFFEKQVRPMLAAKCFGCHGAKKQESGLRLDSREAVLKGGEGGPIVKVGHPDESRLIHAVLRKDGLEMPPDEKMDAAQIDALSKWVRIGLPWPADTATDSAAGKESWKTHWAFQPIRNPPAPEVKNAGWVKTSIDRFVLSKIEDAGIAPSPEADRRTLIRRATFDLIGLPPTPEEVAAFENDGSPDAYEKLIDRLLASPHYGQHWGRHWLDVARYADNKGYVFFEEKKFPWAYTYRDYVVDALNADLPFDRFVLEQLAADQLDLGDDKRPLRALGFLTLGARFMNNLHDVLDDRIDVVSRGLMGMTVTCARCHDHKYDPIPQEDYYALYGVFRNSSEPILPPLFSPPPESDEYRKFDAEMKAREKKLSDFVNLKHAELVTSARSRVSEYLLAAYAQRNQPPTDDFMLLVEKGGLNPMMVLRWQIFLEKHRGRHDLVWSAWHAYANLDEKNFAALAPAVTAALMTAATSATETGRNEHALNPLILQALSRRGPISMSDVANCYAEMLIGIDRKWQAALEDASKRGATVPTGLPDSHEDQLRRVFYGPDAPPDVPLMTGWGFLTLLPDRPAQQEFEKLLKEVETWSMTGPGAPPRAMVLIDDAVPHDARVFMRGNPNRLGAPVSRHFLSVLDADCTPFGTGSGRLDLARAIVDEKNPLTARVFVNRVWMHHFGAGLVETPSDFGLRSNPPSHPELLDHLARMFIESGWSVKRLHRLILLSAAYRQQSHDSDAAAAIDPTNRLLWKMNRRRLDFEAMRDALLSTAGALDEQIGGPSIDLLGEQFVPRRTIYGYIDRMDLPGLLRAFDFPDPASTAPKRDSTTVAPQALYLMNNQFAAELSRRLASRNDVADLADIDQRVQRLYQILYSRSPTDREVALAHPYLGGQPTPEAWSAYVQALLMANEFVFVD